MVVILRNLRARAVLARPQEQLLAKTYTHLVSFLYIGLGIAAIPAILLVGISLTWFFYADWIFVIAVLLTLPFLWFVIRFGTYPFQEILVTDRSIYRVRWGRVGLRWGVTKFVEIPLEAIVAIQVKQTELGQALGYGNIALQFNIAPGRATLRFVPNPYRFNAVIERAVTQRHLVPPISDEGRQQFEAELQNSFDQKFIDEAEFESAKTGLFGQNVK